MESSATPEIEVAAHRRRHGDGSGESDDQTLRFDPSVPVEEIVIGNREIRNPEDYTVVGVKVTCRGKRPHRPPGGSFRRGKRIPQGAPLGFERRWNREGPRVPQDQNFVKCCSRWALQIVPAAGGGGKGVDGLQSGVPVCSRAFPDSPSRVR
jgi:hypothetical protein